MEKENRDGILPRPWQNLVPCMISLGISVHTLVDYGVCCPTVPPECCMSNRPTGCCAMKTWNRGVRTVLGAMNVPSGCYSSCRLISIIVGTVLHSTALLFECLYTWWCLSCVWGSVLEKFSLLVPAVGVPTKKGLTRTTGGGIPCLSLGGGGGGSLHC